MVVALREAFGSTTTPADYRYLADETRPECKLRIYRAFPKRNFRPPCLVVSVDPGTAKFRYLDDEVVKQIYRVYNEAVSHDTLEVTPACRLATITDGITTYVEDTDFTVNLLTGLITWLIPTPTAYTATYDTFKFTRKDQTVPYAKKVQSQLRVPISIDVHALSTTDRERLTDLVVLYVRHVFLGLFKRKGVTYIDIKLGGETETTWDNQIIYGHTITLDVWSQYANEIPMDLYALIERINVDVAINQIGGTE